MTAKRDGIQKRINGDGTVTYRAQVRLRGFAPQSKSFARRTDAKQWVESTKTAIRGGTAISTEAQRTTLHDALDRYLREVTPLKKGKARETGRVKAWMAHPLAFRFLSQLRGVDFAEYRDQRRKDGKAENTIAIELKIISKLYKTAMRDWGMEGLRNPIENVTMPGGSKRRERRVSAAEIKALQDHLRKQNAYLAPLAELAIETAMRQGELLSLTWADVDQLKRIAYLRDTKNSEPRDVPLSTRAIEILKALPRSIDDATSVFPLSQDYVIRAFRQACNDAKIADLKFHDLRHEAVSRFFERNMNVMEVAAISGHKTLQMLKRYTHLKAEDLAKKLA